MCCHMYGRLTYIIYIILSYWTHTFPSTVDTYIADTCHASPQRSSPRHVIRTWPWWRNAHYLRLVTHATFWFLRDAPPHLCNSSCSRSHAANWQASWFAPSNKCIIIDHVMLAWISDNTSLDSKYAMFFFVGAHKLVHLHMSVELLLRWACQNLSA